MGEPAAGDASKAGHDVQPHNLSSRRNTDSCQPTNNLPPDQPLATLTSTPTSGSGSTPADGPPHNPKKRRSPPTEQVDSPCHDTRDSGEGFKKARLDDNHAGRPSRPSVRNDELLVLNKSLLPPEVWHHIFTFCPPRSLGNLLRVNKLFNAYLDALSSVHRKVPLSASPSSLSPLKPGVIWQASRRLFWPQMPAPLRSMDELGMWRLACTPRCQVCQKPAPKGCLISSLQQVPSPGVDGVAVIWAFAMRLCVTCLLQKSFKELDLLVSPSIPSAIIPALPFIHLRGDLQILPIGTAEQSQPSPDVQTTKLFLRSDVKLLEERFSEVQNMGSGAVDEWLKGLSGEGKELRQQALKWEKWEVSGGVAKMLTLLYPGWRPKSPRLQPRDLSTSLTALSHAPTNTPPLPLAHPLPSPPLNRPISTAAKMAELKAARQAEMERRALQLDPPLTANVLHQLPAFKAATQITTPLDDSAWELLKPRLLDQRHEVEGKESASAKAEGDLEPTYAASKEARELVDKRWEDAQAPLRARIAGYADEIISDSWHKAKKLTKGNCAKFAVDVLVHVRRRFYAEVAKAAKAARAAGQPPPTDPPAGPFAHKLTLENMRWLFNAKIKPHTDPLRKEMFYCNGCEAGNHKVFGFEGVIQHYASKHTSTLSLGSIVVHWRAEWPEHPPFSADAPRAERPVYGLPFAPFANGAVPPMAPFSQPFSTPPAGAPVYPPPRPFVPPQQGDLHLHPLVQPYQPPGTFPPLPMATGYTQPAPYAPPQAPFQQYPAPVGPYPADPAESAAVYGISPTGTYPPSYGPYQPNGPAGPAFPVPGPATHPSSHRTKLEDIARNARGVWQSLGNIKDLPGSARVFITIHHVVKRYRAKFRETPPLAMFNDGLANLKEMRPVRNVNNLVCKACHLGLGNSAPTEQDRKTFSLPQLTNHFLAKHTESMQTLNVEPLDWIVDMVLLPDQASLCSLPSALHGFEKSLVADALPELFNPKASPAANGHPDQQVGTHQRANVQNSSTVIAANGEKHQPHGLPPRPPAPIGLPRKPIAAAEHPRGPVAGPFKPSSAPNGMPDGDPSGNGNDWPSSPNQQPKRDRKSHRGNRGKKQPASRRENGQGAGAGDPPYADAKPAHHQSHGGTWLGEGEAREMPPALESQPVHQGPAPEWMDGPREEPHVTSALERQLGIGLDGVATGPQHPPSTSMYVTGRNDATEMENRGLSGGYSRHGPDSDVPRPPRGSYRPSGRDSPPTQPRPNYHTRPPFSEQRGPAYDAYHPQQDRREEVMPPPRFADRRYDAAPVPHQEVTARYAPEAYRHHEEATPRPRQTVEAYEIVEVIEGDKQYYYRRPVYASAAPQVWREQPIDAGGGYPARDPYHAAESRPAHSGHGVPLPREAQYRREPRQEEGYFEEYDPRYPAA